MNTQHALAAPSIQHDRDLDPYEQRLVQRLAHETHEQLIQRILSQRATIRSFARCLDGLEIDKAVPGGGLDAMRDAGDIRRIVMHLAQKDVR